MYLSWHDNINPVKEFIGCSSQRFKYLVIFYFRICLLVNESKLNILYVTTIVLYYDTTMIKTVSLVELWIIRHGHPHGYPYRCPYKRWEGAYPYGYPRCATIYLDIHTEIRIDIHLNEKRAWSSVRIFSLCNHLLGYPHGYPCGCPCRIIRATLTRDRTNISQNVK